MAEEKSVKKAIVASKSPITSNLTKKLKPVYLIFAALVVVTLFSLYQFNKARQELKNFKANPQEATSKEVEEIVDKVGKLIDLPKDEIPTIATVTNPEKLKDQAFFNSAKEGDKVLIYNDALKAILYRPSSNKVIDTAPINIGESSSQSKTDKTSQEISFTILNGTTIEGLAGRYRNKVEGEISEAKILSVGNAQADDVGKTFIVDSSANNSSQLSSIAKKLGIETGSLPEDQLDSEADFIIIVGTDQN